MRTRVISGAVLAAIVLTVLILGGWYMYGFCVCISLVGMYELNKVKGQEKTVLAIIAYISALAYYFILVKSASVNTSSYILLLLVATCITMLAIYVFTFPKYKAEDVMWAFFSLIYVAVMLSYIYQVRIMQDGAFVICIIFIASWGNDTFAYFSGVLFGKHKMAPVLSPKKTIEGAIGGVLGCVAIGFGLGYAFSAHMSEVLVHPVYTFAGASFVGAFLAIIGDLAASAIKRNYDVKDYGTIIPGHGGIMDRFDSVIFTAPAVYWAIDLINRFFIG